jgi:hypothetical protein
MYDAGCYLHCYSFGQPVTSRKRDNRGAFVMIFLLLDVCYIYVDKWRRGLKQVFIDRCLFLFTLFRGNACGKIGL